MSDVLCLCLSLLRAQGIPSHQLLSELTEGGDPNASMAAAIAVRA